MTYKYCETNDGLIHYCLDAIDLPKKMAHDDDDNMYTFFNTNRTVYTCLTCVSELSRAGL